MEGKEMFMGKGKREYENITVILSVSTFHFFVYFY
jgi:hypothetical protein